MLVKSYTAVATETLDLAELVPTSARFAIVVVTSDDPIDFSVTSRESQSDVSISGQTLWEGDIPMGRSKEMIFSLTNIPSGGTARVYVAGFKE
jgi:hypothetical protein